MSLTAIDAETSWPLPGSTSSPAATTWSRLAESGVIGACLPVELGGRGLGAEETSELLERAGYEHNDTGAVFGAAAHLLACAVAVRDFASDMTRRALLPRLASGAAIAANAMTEPGAGSDVAVLSTQARRVEGGWVLDGHKSFASNAPIADIFVTYACSNPADTFLGNTSFVVERDASVLVEPLDKMGLEGCAAGTVTFRNTFVPDEHVLGSPGSGGQIFQHTMLWERACLFAIYLGVMQQQVERAVDHVRSRTQQGRALADHQVLTHRIAEMQRRLLAARALQREAARGIDRGEENVMIVSASKITVSEAAVANSLDAIQIFGGTGYLRSAGIETGVRDAIPSRIFSGTNEIHRSLIAREVGL